jgi:hypothetical protein
VGGITTTTKGCKLKTIIISLSDKTVDETVTAEYFQIEDGWITFKTEDHKAVVAYPEKRVTRIKSEPQGPKMTFDFSGATSEEEVERIVRAAAKAAADLAGRS